MRQYTKSVHKMYMAVTSMVIYFKTIRKYWLLWTQPLLLSWNKKDKGNKKGTIKSGPVEWEAEAEAEAEANDEEEEGEEVDDDDDVKKEDEDVDEDEVQKRVRGIEKWQILTIRTNVCLSFIHWPQID